MNKVLDDHIEITPGVAGSKPWEHVPRAVVIGLRANAASIR
jgi:hypothetical protein